MLSVGVGLESCQRPRGWPGDVIWSQSVTSLPRNYTPELMQIVKNYNNVSLKWATSYRQPITIITNYFLIWIITNNLSLITCLLLSTNSITLNKSDQEYSKYCTIVFFFCISGGNRANNYFHFPNNRDSIFQAITGIVHLIVISRKIDGFTF